MSDNAKGFEKALRDSFTLAESWNAIVVLQGAEIHLRTESQIYGGVFTISHMFCVLMQCSFPSGFRSISWVCTSRIRMLLF